MELADKLLLLRKEKGWTQATAAKNIAIQQSYLSKLENGHYQPSTDVIEKLCIAYGVKATEFTTQSKRVSSLDAYTMLGAVVGVVLFVNGYFALIFPQTYYTYKTQALSEVSEQTLSLNYHLTDQYKGDKYVEVFSDISYEYSLVATREISRSENRWLMSGSSLLLLIALSVFVYSALIKIKSNAS